MQKLHAKADAIMTWVLLGTTATAQGVCIECCKTCKDSA